MQPIPFLLVDNQPIYFQQAIQYLQASGKFNPLVTDILRQYLLEREVNFRQDLEINPALTEQAMVDFRLQNNLTDPKKFQQWLQENNTNYEALHQRLVATFKLTKLKNTITESKLQEYFIEKKIFLDRVVLSRIIVDNKELAEEIFTQIEEGSSFEKLAQEWSMAEDKVVNGMLGPVSRGSIPDNLRAPIDKAKQGEVIGPIELEGRWGLFRVEQFLSASLDDVQLKQTLENEIFDQWLTDQMKKMDVKFQMN